MAGIGQHQVKGFGLPVPPWDDNMGPVLVRGNDNAIVVKYDAHDNDASMHNNNGTIQGPITITGGGVTVPVGASSFQAVSATAITATSVTAGTFESGKGVVTAVPNNTATTLFAISGTNGVLAVWAADPDSTAASSSAFGFISCLSNTYNAVFTNGSKMVLTISGNNLQATQTSGISQDVSYKYTWMVAG